MEENEGTQITAMIKGVGSDIFRRGRRIVGAKHRGLQTNQSHEVGLGREPSY